MHLPCQIGSDSSCRLNDVLLLLLSLLLLLLLLLPLLLLVLLSVCVNGKCSHSSALCACSNNHYSPDAAASFLLHLQPLTRPLMSLPMIHI
jgi:hypothetical protein